MVKRETNIVMKKTADKAFAALKRLLKHAYKQDMSPETVEMLEAAVESTHTARNYYVTEMKNRIALKALARDARDAEKLAAEHLAANHGPLVPVESTTM